MAASWRFNTVRPGDRTRESQVEKFFKAEGDRADPIVREGIQNSLDAAPDDKIVRVRLTLGARKTADGLSLWKKYAAELEPHLNALGDKLADPPQSSDAFRFLVFEDFETSGLKGDPAQWQIVEGVKNGFFEFFRAEGVSTKEGSSRGRHGVGKFVFMAASRVRTIFGLTRRDDGRELLMGTTVLRHHHLDGTHYMPDGWYGLDDPNAEHNVLPLENDPAIAAFKQDFHVSRNTESGLTIVVPWLDPVVQRNSLIRAVVEGYFFPLMRNLLVVEVVDENGDCEKIDHVTLRDVVDRQGEEYTRQVLPRLKLAEEALQAKSFVALQQPPGENSAPKWSSECFTSENIADIRAKTNGGEMLALKVPTRIRRKGERASEESSFEIFLRREQGSGEFDAHFIRQGILVSEVRPRRVPGLRAIVSIDDGPLATFLGDAENPAHTEWLSEHVKQYSFNKATID